MDNMPSSGTRINNLDMMATAETNSFPPQLLEQVPAEKNAQALFIDGDVSFQEHIAHQQSQLINPLTYVCEWVTTSLRLPSQDAQEDDIYLCLPVHLTETSYFKQNEGKEEYKDDGYCNGAATRLRLRELDRYLAAVAPLASSTRRLLLGDLIAQNNDGNRQVQKMGHRERRSKYERQSLLYAKRLTRAHHRLITSTNAGRVIYVLQGEIAHCTPSQADVLLSDDATTCHILALRSRYLVPGKGEETNNISTVLATMTHIDGPGYKNSLRGALSQHIKYHSIHSRPTFDVGERGGIWTDQYGTIEMSIHIVGGFNDQEGSSIEITDSVLQTFASLSNEYNANSTFRRHPHLRMTLETCAVASANDNGTGCPLGRGLAMEVATGEVFLAEVEDRALHGTASSSTPPTLSGNGVGVVALNGDLRLPNPSANSSYISAQGPGVTLRSVRLWATAFHSSGGKQESRLNVIHRPNRDYLFVDPFFFGPHPAASDLLGCSNEELLQITSTSPEVEKSNFVIKVRNSLNFMNGSRSARVFLGHQPMKFQRVGLNGWVRIS